MFLTNLMQRLKPAGLRFANIQQTICVEQQQPWMSSRSFGTKLKTRKAVAKRFTVTGSGHVKRGQSNGRHILTKKSAVRKNRLKNSATIFGQMKKNMLSMIH